MQVDGTASAGHGDGAGKMTQENSGHHERKAKTAAVVNNVDTGPVMEKGGGADLETAGWSSELKHLSVLGLGLSVSWIGWTMKETVDLAVIGRLGETYLTGVSMAFFWIESTYSLLLGNMISSVCSMSIGAGSPELAGSYLQVSLLVHGLVAVPVGVSWACTGPLLFALGVAQDVSDAASYYTLVCVARLPARVFTDQVVAYFAGLHMVEPGMASSIFGVLVNAGLQVAFVLALGLGFAYVPIITSAVQWAELAVVMGIYWAWQGRHRGHWPSSGWSWGNVTLSRVMEFSLLNFPAALSMASDVWRQAAIGVIALIFLGDQAVAIYSINYRISYLYMILIAGLSDAMVVRVGKALGSGRIEPALLTARVAFWAAFAIAAATSVCTALLSRRLSLIFTSDELLLQEFEEAKYATATFIFLYLLSHQVQFIVVAMGRTQVAMWLGVVGSWLVQVPCVWASLQFWRTDIVGLYAGVSAGYIVMIGALGIFLRNASWQVSVGDAQRRAEVGQKSGIKAVGGGGC